MIILVWFLVMSCAHSQCVKKEYKTGPLAGRQFSGFLYDLTGIHGQAPEIVRINFCDVLERLWKMKENRSRNLVVSRTATKIVQEYKTTSPGTMTLKEYAKLIQRDIEQTFRDLDWNKVGKIEGLDTRRLALVKKIVATFTGKDFLAYSMTELMPTTDGMFNAYVYGFLLRNAGRKFIESIPALYDDYTSFGPYQFTQYAWYDAGGECRGGSRVNTALKHPIFHGSVSKLRGNEHHVAAFLFAVDNTAKLVLKLNQKQLSLLMRIYRSRHAEVIQYIATAHNFPNGRHGAEGAVLRWLENNARRSYIISCTWRPRLYARKTAANLAALDTLL